MTLMQLRHQHSFSPITNTSITAAPNMTTASIVTIITNSTAWYVNRLLALQRNCAYVAISYCTYTCFVTPNPQNLLQDEQPVETATYATGGAGSGGAGSGGTGNGGAAEVHQFLSCAPF